MWSRLSALAANRLPSSSASVLVGEATALIRPTTLNCGPSARNLSAKSPTRPPAEPGPEECCGTGCSDCTYLRYAEELVDYYRDGGAAALKEVDKIKDPSVRVFVRTEMKFYLALDDSMRRRMKQDRDARSENSDPFSSSTSQN